MIRSDLRGGLDFPRIRKYPVRVEVCNISIWFTVCHKKWYRETCSTWCVRSLEIVRPLPKCVTRGTLAPFRHPRKRNGTSQNFKTILFTRKITPTESHSWEVPQANNPKSERNSPGSTGTRCLFFFSQFLFFTTWSDVTFHQYGCEEKGHQLNLLVGCWPPSHAEPKSVTFS